MNRSFLRSMGIGFRRKAPLREVTTFKRGGPCSLLLDCQTPAQLTAVMREAVVAHEPIMLIGGGSNLLVADEGWDGLVIRYLSPQPLLTKDSGGLEVSGSTLLDDVVAYTVEQGLDGLGFAGGIPGTIGGAVAGNAGAFGKQIGDCIHSVLLLDRRGATRWAFAGDLGFGYRSSRLQKEDAVVVSARLRLEPGDRAALQQERSDILALRREKHPDWTIQPTAGSFFKNIEPSSAAERRQAAGWFLEQAGAKHLSVGSARVFEKHANIIVADPTGSADDVLELAQLMAEAVERKFGFRLLPEVRIVGAFKTDRGVFPIIGKAEGSFQ